MATYTDEDIAKVILQSNALVRDYKRQQQINLLLVRKINQLIVETDASLSFFNTDINETKLPDEIKKNESNVEIKFVGKQVDITTAISYILLSISALYFIFNLVVKLFGV